MATTLIGNQRKKKVLTLFRDTVMDACAEEQYRNINIMLSATLRLPEE